MNKMNYYINECSQKSKNLNYIINTTHDLFCQLNVRTKLTHEDERATLNLNFNEEHKNIVTEVLLDKIADIIVVNYKYDYFTRYIRTCGLTSLDYEMLIASLISADLDEDKRYILKGNLDLTDFSIDGYFNFRLKPLKEKWTEIVGYIPIYFTLERLNDFVSYIVTEKRGKRCYIYNNKVYDSHYNRMQKGFLTKNIESGTVAREVILSGFSEAELNTKLSETDQKYLTNFLGDKIFFKKEKNT